MKFFIKGFFKKCDQNQRKLPVDLVTFTEEILNGKLHFLCSKIKTTRCAFSKKNLLVRGRRI